MNELDVGEVADIATYWWDADKVPTEPTDITLTITKPDGTVVVMTKANMSGAATTTAALDKWNALVVVDAAGVWRYTPSGTVGPSTVTQAEEVFLVGAEAEGGPCDPWCTWDEVAACNQLSLDSIPPATRESVIDTASTILYNLTGEVYTGICVRTRSLCLCCWGCAPFACGCDRHDSIDLGPLPVRGVWDVVVAGETLAASAYTITERRYLTRIDGNLWPRGTDFTDLSAFRATWARGRQVPRAGRNAAARFAAEIAKSCLDASCLLPQGVTMVNREGVTYTMMDVVQMTTEGRTGVPLVDLWIASDKLARKMKPNIYSPGAMAMRQTQ